MIEFANQQSKEPDSPLILPIASGKGGVGKSMLTVNLAAAFADRGFRVLIIDLDFGCANIHTYLGVKNKNRGLSDYFTHKSIHLDTLPVETPVNGLDIILGEQHIPDSANINHQTRKRLLLDIRDLGYDIVLLDLGAGTHANVLDFFIMSEKSIMVTVPSHGAILNAYSFMKSALFRIFKNNFSENKYKKLIEQLKKRDDMGQYPTFWDLLNDIASIDYNAAVQYKDSLEKIKPWFFFNMVEENKDSSFMKNLFHMIYEKLVISPEMLGYMPMLDSIHKSVKKRTPFFNTDQHASGLIAKIVDRIIHNETSGIKRPAEETQAFKNHSVFEELSSDAMLLNNPNTLCSTENNKKTANHLPESGMRKKKNRFNRTPIMNKAADYYLKKSLKAAGSLS